MGASLSINLTQLRTDEVNRTAIVNVEVSVISTDGTHNNYTGSDGATFSLIIDGGNPQSYITPFGSADSGTYTTTLYSGSFTVRYNSDGTKTVSVNASLDTNGTTAGTISKFASLTLTPISSSDGGSGGGNGSGDGSGGNDTIEGYKIYIDNGITWDLYNLYIDNGITWDLYNPYIDNDATWEPL